MSNLINKTLIFLLIMLISIKGYASKDYYFERSIHLDIYDKLPKILSEQDLKVYHQAYNLQKKGNFKESDIVLEKLNNNLLLGYIYYIRYTNSNYNPTYNELKLWLDKYHSLPIASLLYKKAQTKAKTKREKLALKNPNGFYSSFTPIYARHNLFKQTTPTLETATSTKVVPKNNYITKQIKNHIKNGHTLNVKRILQAKDTKNKLDNKTYSYYAYLLGKVYFLDGRDDFAIQWLRTSLKIYPNLFPESFFTIGLAYFRKGQYKEAMEAFSNLFLNKKYNFSAHMISKGSYWYARSAFMKGDINNYYVGLFEASKYLYNFYGIIAIEELGLKPDYSWNYLEFPKSSTKPITSLERGKRALALLQLGLLDWAEQELIFLFLYNINYLDKKQEIEVLNGLIYLSQNAPMPALSYKLAGENGKYYGLSHFSYPVLPSDFYSDSNVEVNPLLILALIKRESTFLSGAISPVGAAGMMQMMPKTADFIVKKYDLDPSLSESFSLTDPKNNIKLGQKYIQTLLENPYAQNNLIYVLAGFNGGFHNVKRWQKDAFRNINDPLFFIESIPYYETRNYVKSVVTDYWVYEYKANLKPLTLYAIVRGSQPIYTPLTPEESLKVQSFRYN